MYLVTLAVEYTSNIWDVLESHEAETIEQAEEMANQLRDTIEEIGGIIDWHISVEDGLGEIITLLAMDDAQSLYDHRVAMAHLGSAERIDARNQPVPEGYMLIGTRDNFDIIMHNAMKRVHKK